MSRFLDQVQLSKETSIFGLSPWVVLGISIGAAFVLLLFLLSLWLTSIRSTTKPHKPNLIQPQPHPIPVVSRDIQEIRVDPISNLPDPVPDSGQIGEQAWLLKLDEEGGTIKQQQQQQQPRIHIEMGKGHRIMYPAPAGSSLHGHHEVRSGADHQPVMAAGNAMVGPQVSHLGWGHWYTLRELEDSTNCFAHENVIGEGGYGIVYHGVLEDNTQVAVKNLLNNRGQADKEFEVEVEAIGRVRHKNLVRLLGYCAEGAHRILVYEFVNNGNLEQWLHGDVGPCSPLTWEIRMNIVLGTAKGLSYLHEGLEPKVVHRDIKSSNILLDKLWNPKVSDFGLAKLLGAECSYITTRVMGTFGYVAPEYASTGMLNERSDIYSFGILIMELITGRNPVDYSRPPGEVNLVEWLKKMVSDRNPDGVLDPKLQEKPSSRALKRALLVALRCVDPIAQKRPKMGYVINMLETEEQSPFNDRRAGRDRRVALAHGNSPKDEKLVTESGNINDLKGAVQVDGD